MKKISFFLFYRDKKKMLYQLQKAGIFHMELSAEGGSPRFRKSKMLQKRHESINEVLKHVSTQKKSEKTENHASHIHEAKDLVQYLEDTIKLKDNFKNAIQEVRKEKNTAEPWGNFSWDKILALRAKKIYLRFFIGSDVIYDSYDFHDITHEEIRRMGGRIYFITVEYGDSRISLPFEEVQLPQKSLAEIDEELSYLRENHSWEDELQITPDNIKTLNDRMNSIKSQIVFEEAKGSIEPDSSGLFYFIDGWYPARKEKEIFAILEAFGISYTTMEPAETDDVPILLRNSFFSKLFEPITKIFSLPDYFELDPTPFFAPFFIIFFGLCLGDAGYGAILFSASLSFNFRVKSEMRLFTWLGMVLGLSAIASGILTNTVFGENLFIVEEGGGGFIETANALAFFSSRSIDGKTVFPAMHLSLLLGYVQIYVGQILQIINYSRNKEYLYTALPMGSILILTGLPILSVHNNFLNLGFNADYRMGNFPLGMYISAIPAISGKLLIAAGLILMFVLNNPGKPFFLRPLLGLWEFYGFVTGLLGDFLSYIRLFALGLAGGLLGNAFNQIAFMVLPEGEGGKDFSSPWIILAVFLLVAGHGLNLILSLLGSFVHPLRLTFVEFYKNMKFKGGGKIYRPFAVIK